MEHTLYSNNPEPQLEYLIENPGELCEQLGLELDTVAEWNAVLQHDRARLNEIANFNTAINCESDLANTSKEFDLWLILVGKKVSMRAHVPFLNGVLQLGIDSMKATHSHSFVTILDVDGDIVVKADSEEVARIREVSEEQFQSLYSDEDGGPTCEALFKNAKPLGRYFQEVYGY